MARKIVLEDFEFELVSDDPHCYYKKELVLHLDDGSGRRTEVYLDGIQLGDLILDAIAVGMPATFYGKQPEQLVAENPEILKNLPQPWELCERSPKQS